MGRELAVDQDALPPLAEGEYYFFQLKGLKAVDLSGNELGTVSRMEASAAQNLIRLKKLDGRQALIPYIDVFVKGRRSAGENDHARSDRGVVDENYDPDAVSPKCSRFSDDVDY